MAKGATDTLATRKAVLRSAKSADTTGVLAFYEKFPSKNILNRETAFRDACENGRQFLIEIDGAVAATSGYYPIGTTRDVEVGGTRVPGDFGGFTLNGKEDFSLQSLFFWVRFAAIALTEDREARITTVIDPDNAAKSQAAAKAIGFNEWDNPIEELLVDCDPREGHGGCDKKKAGLPPGKRCCSSFYLLPAQGLRKALPELLAATKESNVLEFRRKHKTSGVDEAIFITVNSLTVTSDQREILEAIAQGS